MVKSFALATCDSTARRRADVVGDGRTLFYRLGDPLMQVMVETNRTFTAGLPTTVIDRIFNLPTDSGVSYQPEADGKRFLMLRRAESSSGGNIRIITRWFHELRTIK